ncbi:N-acetyl-gamma-glutamyl-phosphate reductase [Natronosporangium hydrolyticum]|uniref:N-acetyl-gamma-glutamyl-phosphate reductase n=1 Tax=Natronosporangium hydrolyticum TaxID=2811111 RepID=A0A895YB63_9ACTN|nr:N-acetyl-gamma-glutamyl-phosphate reductase [Natronosporangium hydrolyticum]QSB12569.1 N-acetyl-gamma-glutamyl-phosphate reductase [Natronosporangium hydrolyticum]
MGTRVAVAGASGYAGGELLRLIAGHPELQLTAATAHQQAGAAAGQVHPQLAATALGEWPLVATDPAALGEADLIFLALPHGESAALAARLPASAKVVDLGADHRLVDPAAWTEWYGGPHAGAWTYGLPELPGHRSAIAGADRVAATGCYAATVTLALAPLLAAGLVEPADVVVVAASGTSGAGRAAKPHLLASEVMGGLSPYKVGAHQHVPEIKQATGAASISFTPLLAPMPRGILATVTARPARSVTVDEAREVLDTAYQGEPFVRLLPAGQWPHTGATLGANTCLLQAGVDRDSGRVLVTSALDNLGKGAAGQAVQCANLMLGLPETAGLATIGVAP